MKTRLVLALVLAQAALGIAACGARSQLDVGAAANDGGGGAQATHDAGVDRDAATSTDALPPIDATPPNDASSCPINGLTAYVLEQDGSLFSYDPDALAATLLGRFDCHAQGRAWTLSAASNGLLYVLYEDWKIYEVDPKTLTCKPTAYDPRRLEVGDRIGITVAPPASGGGEVMYVYGAQQAGPVLAVGDLDTLAMKEVGLVLPAPAEYPLDVRADAFGRIFGLSPTGTFVEIDRTTAAVVAADQTFFDASGTSWAILTWNDDLYFFAGAAVYQYDLASKSLAMVGDLGTLNVVGASAAPCLH